MEAWFFMVLAGGIDCGILWYVRDPLVSPFRDYNRL
jgi:hypothetical protein